MSKSRITYSEWKKIGKKDGFSVERRTVIIQEPEGSTWHWEYQLTPTKKQGKVQP